MQPHHSDPMARIVYDHANISEFVENYEKLIDIKYSGRKWQNTDEVKAFFQRAFFDHFEFEETVVFPAVLEHAPNQSLMKPLIEQLTEDHEEMRKLLKEIIMSLSSSDSPLTDRQYRAVLDNSLPLFERMQEHAALEDDRLVPVLRRIPHAFAKKNEGGETAPQA